MKRAGEFEAIATGCRVRAGPRPARALPASARPRAGARRTRARRARRRARPRAGLAELTLEDRTSDLRGGADKLLFVGERELEAATLEQVLLGARPDRSVSSSRPSLSKITALGRPPGGDARRAFAGLIKAARKADEMAMDETWPAGACSGARGHPRDDGARSRAAVLRRSGHGGADAASAARQKRQRRCSVEQRRARLRCAVGLFVFAPKVSPWMLQFIVAAGTSRSPARSTTAATPAPSTASGTSGSGSSRSSRSSAGGDRPARARRRHLRLGADPAAAEQLGGALDHDRGHRCDRRHPGRGADRPNPAAEPRPCARARARAGFRRRSRARSPDQLRSRRHGAVRGRDRARPPAPSASLWEPTADGRALTATASTDPGSKGRPSSSSSPARRCSTPSPPASSASSPASRDAAAAADPRRGHRRRPRDRVGEAITEPSDELSQVIALLSLEGALALERAATLARLERVARTDDLTGLANRRAWDEHLSREVARAKRTGELARDRAARPRSLQGLQRHPRPPRGRPAAQAGCGRVDAGDPRDRHPRSLRRRGVRRRPARSDRGGGEGDARAHARRDA